MVFDNALKRMKVESLPRGIIAEQVRENRSFELFFRKTFAATAGPLDEQLNILRNEVDQHGYIIGRA